MADVKPIMGLPVAILTFLMQVLSGAMLLLFSVRFMRIGIERVWGGQIHSSLNGGASSVQNLARGAGLGFLLQGATPVMLIAAGFAGAGAISVATAAVVVLGADLGSALAVQFLHLPVSDLGLVAVLVGAALYLRASQPRYRNFGRALLGLGLVFLSLTLIRTAVVPLGSMPGTSAAVATLNSDPITAALAGAALTVLMHSSVAAILTVAAISGHVALGPAAGLAFMLGCNLGSSLLPLWLLKHENQRSRVVAMSVAALRCGAAVLFIIPVAVVGSRIDAMSPVGAAEAILGGHVGFNLLLMFFAPLCWRLANYLEQRWASEESIAHSALSPDMVEDSDLALAAIKRQLSGMLEIASSMLEEVASANPDRERMAALERTMNVALADLRNAYARLPDGDDGCLADVQPIVEFAIRVERCGDVLSGKHLQLRMNQLHGDYAFSPEGEAEIAELIEAVRRAIILAQETAWTGDVASASRLVRHKQDVANLESRSRSQHLARLRLGNLVSLSSSDQHLEIIAALKEVNSKFATIGYAVLERHGGLKKTRLKSSIRASAN